MIRILLLLLLVTCSVQAQRGPVPTTSFAAGLLRLSTAEAMRDYLEVSASAEIGNFTYPINSGEQATFEMPVTSASPANTVHSFGFSFSDNNVFKIVAQSDGAGGIEDTGIEVNGAELNRTLTVYAAGTAYAMTDASALIDFGTTDPTLVIDKAGTWLIHARANIKYNAATYAGTQTATVKLRRTNNTAGDVSNGTSDLPLRILTTETDSAGVLVLPPVVYTTVNANDSISLYGILSALPGAGSVDVIEASIVAIRQK